MSHKKKQAGKGNKYKTLKKKKKPQRIKKKLKERKNESKGEERVFRSGYKTNSVLEMYGDSIDQSC